MTGAVRANVPARDADPGSVKTARVDDITVTYTNRGSGTPVLFMHGNPDTRHSWEPLVDHLGDGYRCIAPDFPGFGDSQPFPNDVPLVPETFAGFWDRFADAIGLREPVAVVVHDFGGPWLLPWVATHPERTRALFVMNTVFHCDYSWHSWARIWQTPLLGELAMAATTRGLLRREMRINAPGVGRDQVDAAYRRLHRTMRRTVLRTYRSHARPDEVFRGWEEKLQAATEQLPVSVVWGDLDPYIPARYADRFGVAPEHLPDLGHWAHLQAPERVAEHLAALLTGR